jgi:hypothetical protein
MSSWASLPWPCWPAWTEHSSRVVSAASDLCSRLPCRRGSTPWPAHSSPVVCACPPAAEEVKKRQGNDSLLHGDVDKAIDPY